MWEICMEMSYKYIFLFCIYFKHSPSFAMYISFFLCISVSLSGTINLQEFGCIKTFILSHAHEITSITKYREARFLFHTAILRLFFYRHHSIPIRESNEYFAYSPFEYFSWWMVPRLFSLEKLFCHLSSVCIRWNITMKHVTSENARIQFLRENKFIERLYRRRAFAKFLGSLIHRENHFQQLWKIELARRNNINNSNN